MFRSLFALVALLLSVATVILLHSAAILGGCEVSDDAFFFSYANAAIWLALFVFLCLPLLRSIARMIFVNAIPALLGTASSSVVLYQTVGNACLDETLLLTTGSNVVLAVLLLFSELTCPRRSASYVELES